MRGPVRAPALFQDFTKFAIPSIYSLRPRQSVLVNMPREALWSAEKLFYVRIKDHSITTLMSYKHANSRKPILLINQSIGPLFADLVSAVRCHALVFVFKGQRYIKTSSVARALSWLAFSSQLAVHLIFYGQRYGRLLVVSNPPMAPLLAPLARRPYALLLYDLYPQVLSQLNPSYQLQRWALSQLVRTWHSVNRLVFSRAERIFTLSSAMANELRPYFDSDSVWSDRVLVIPPWADISNMRPSPAGAQIFRRRYGVDGLLLIYSGNLGLTHPLEVLLEACVLLETLPFPPHYHILLVGNGPKRISLQQRAHQLQLPSSRLRFLGILPYSELPASLSAADLAVVALDGPSAAASLPSKTFNALACGTPILALAPHDSALSRLVQENNCGFVIEPGQNASQHLADLIIHLNSDSTDLQQLGTNALTTSLNYTPKNAERLVDSWLEPVKGC